MATMFANCAQGAGEWFTIGIAGEQSKPRLASARLESDEPGVDSAELGQHFVYSGHDKLRVPEKITLVWVVKGEEAEHRAEFRLREQIPAHVFQLIASKARPPHAVGLYFRVVNGQPECKWMLGRVDGKGAGGTELEEGLVKGEYIP
jgi:hypothetical protein